MINLSDGWEGACGLAGFPFPPEERTPALQAGWHRIEQAIGTGQLAEDAYFAELAALLGERYTVAQLRAAYQAIIREEFPGIRELVRGLKEAGYVTACLSNTSAPHWVDLTNPARYPGIGLLDLQYASHLFGAMKPDPAIYRHFEAATGFSPEAILFFDDLPQNVEAARACGWHAEQIVPGIPAVTQLNTHLTRHGVLVAECTGLPREE